jgi:alkanesulfonate monooxygenase SsuD/methylene tetrahydromethanopterin reductase-like flavin-dependent oxidoreductase (luciferase family)
MREDWEKAKREASLVAVRRAKDAEFHPQFFLPSELEHLRRDAEAVARHYDVHRHVDPDAPHNRLVSDAVVDAMTLVGSPPRVAEQLRAIREAGAMRGAQTLRSVRGYRDLEPSMN